jgi:hypothetical protein
VKAKVVLLKSNAPYVAGRRQPGARMGEHVRRMIQRSIKATLPKE